jgi:hypothetical protein
VGEEDREACLHVRHPGPTAITRGTRPALTGSPGVATIAPIHCRRVIPVFDEIGGSPCLACIPTDALQRLP